MQTAAPLWLYSNRRMCIPYTRHYRHATTRHSFWCNKRKVPCRITYSIYDKRTVGQRQPRDNGTFHGISFLVYYNS